MDEHLAYPGFSSHVVTDMVGLVRSGTLRENQPLALKCAWELTGAGLKMTVGEPGEHEPTFGSDASDVGEPATVEEVKECISTLQSEMNLCASVDGTEAAMSPFMTMLLQAAIQALMAWLAKQETA